MFQKENANAKRTNGVVARKREDDDNNKMERIKQTAIRDALADERVIDEDTFRRSVRAREARAIAEEDEEMRKEYNNISPSRSESKPTPDGLSSTAEKNKTSWTQAQQDNILAKGNDFTISTERADLIVRWIREASPPGSDGASSTGTSRRKAGAKKNPQARLRKQASNMSAVSGVSNASGGSDKTLGGLEQSVESLDMVD